MIENSSRQYLRKSYSRQTIPTSAHPSLCNYVNWFRQDQTVTDLLVELEVAEVQIRHSLVDIARQNG